MKLNGLESRDAFFLLEKHLKEKGLYAKYPISLKEEFVINDFRQANCYAFKSYDSIIMRIDIWAGDTIREFAEYSKNATDYASFMEAQLLAGECSWFLNSNGSEKEEKFELNNFCCNTIGRHEFDCPKARMAEKRVDRVKSENERLKDLLYDSFDIIACNVFPEDYGWDDLWNDMGTTQEEVDQLRIFGPEIVTVAEIDWDAGKCPPPKYIVIPDKMDEGDIAEYLSYFKGYRHRGYILKKMLKFGTKLFDYEININKGHKGEIADEWGCAHLYYDKTGVEYNYCLEEGENNASAIYAKAVDSEGYYEINYSEFVHYEVDFDNPEWEIELLKEMAYAYEKFFEI